MKGTFESAYKFKSALNSGALDINFGVQIAAL
jgi:hypothetical protein